MLATLCPSLVKRLTAFLGLASLSALISLPAAAETEANARGVNQRSASNIQIQQLLPKSTPSLNLVAQVGVRSLTEELVTAGDAFSTLSAAIREAGLADELFGGGPFTIFAPTNEAFEALPSGTVQTLLRPENKARLARILRYHVVPGNINTLGLTPGQTLRLRTLAGQPLTIRVTDASEVFVNGNKVIMADIPATNGTIHGISAVLLP